LILVFGKNGQIGNELSRYDENICLSREDCDFVNINSFKNLIKKFSPSGIINTAAYTNVDGAEEEQDLAYEINSTAPKKLAEACASFKIPLIHISTDYVFDGTNLDLYKEDDATYPLSIYGNSKLLGEQNILMSGAQAIILRTSWVFSSHGKNFLKTMINLSHERESLEIINDQIGAPTSAKSVAYACMKIIHKMIEDKNLSGVFHFSGKPNATWAEFAKEIFKTAKIDIEISHIKTSEFPSKALRPLNSRLNCNKLFNKTGIKQSFWKEELIKVLNEMGIKTNV
tara:strand:- start:1555 stop:2409 length:855 start_codon:yes stop_codon:yes gene_type:complete